MKSCNFFNFFFFFSTLAVESSEEDEIISKNDAKMEDKSSVPKSIGMSNNNNNIRKVKTDGSKLRKPRRSNRIKMKNRNDNNFSEDSDFDVILNDNDNNDDDENQNNDENDVTVSKNGKFSDPIVKNDVVIFDGKKQQKQNNQKNLLNSMRPNEAINSSIKLNNGSFLYNLNDPQCHREVLYNKSTV